MTFSIKISSSIKLKKVKIITPSINVDKRGSIYTFFDKKTFNKILPKNILFSHVKINRRKKNVLVGIHYDKKTWKLVTCLKGKIMQNVSCFENSTNKYKSDNFILKENNSKFILIPPYYGNAFYCYEDSIVMYALAYLGKYNDANQQNTIKWNDPRLKIRWPAAKPILSKRDQ